MNFYGGEPLLSFELVKNIVLFFASIKEKTKRKPLYTLTTNGILLDKEALQFLNKNKFQVELSFDGLAQDIQRRKESFIKIVSLIKQILIDFPEIDLETNSVFIPETVELLAESLEFILQLGLKSILFNLSFLHFWDDRSLTKFEEQMVKLRKIVSNHYRNTGEIPFAYFREKEKKGIFYCSAAKDRMAISAAGEVWGCFLFSDYYRVGKNKSMLEKFRFGNLNSPRQIKSSWKKVSHHYKSLLRENFLNLRPECLECPELEDCTLCPLSASFAGSLLKEIPSYVCTIQKIMIKEKKIFAKKLKI